MIAVKRDDAACAQGELVYVPREGAGQIHEAQAGSEAASLGLRRVSALGTESGLGLGVGSYIRVAV